MQERGGERRAARREVARRRASEGRRGWRARAGRAAAATPRQTRAVARAARSIRDDTVSTQ